MKSFRRLCLAILLTLVFACSGMAGDIQTPTFSDPGITQTPPAASTAPGDMGNPGFAMILWLIKALR